MAYLKLLRFPIAGLAMAAMVSASTAQNLEKITIGLSSSTLPASGARIAKELGLFEKHGLDADMRVMDAGAVATMALISGSFDFTMTGPEDVVVARGRGQDIVLVLTPYLGFAGTLVIKKSVADRLGVSPSAPVAERLKALNGLSIASPSATSPFTLSIKGSAAALGSSPNFSYLAQPAMEAALQTGAIDGFQASSPVWTFPVLKGNAVVWMSGPKGDYPSEFVPRAVGTMHAKGDFVRSRPQTIAKVRATFNDLKQAFRDRPNDVKAAVARLYPTLAPDALDLAFQSEAHAFGSARPLTVDDMKHQIAYMRKAGVELPADLDAAAMLAP
jgi:ABC-type nitrate/sulfonate/bicarbonate transport system substrate-binding protein